MKSALSIAVIALLFAISGCGTTQNKGQNQTSSNLTETKQSLAGARMKVDETLDSLHTLLNAPPNELASAYADYSADVDAMHEYEAALRKSAPKVRSSTREWMSEWKNSSSDIKSNELRKISEQRHEDVKESLSKVSESYREARKAFGPFMENLEDVRAALSSDLTPESVGAVARSNAVRSADKNGKAITKNMDSALAEFGKISDAIPAPEGR